MNLESQIVIELRAEGRGPPLEIRLRRFLKSALRQYGLRCSHIGLASSESSTPAEIGHDCNAEALRGGGPTFETATAVDTAEFELRQFRDK